MCKRLFGQPKTYFVDTVYIQGTKLKNRKEKNNKYEKQYDIYIEPYEETRDVGIYHQ